MICEADLRNLTSNLSPDAQKELSMLIHIVENYKDEIIVRSEYPDFSPKTRFEAQYSKDSWNFFASYRNPNRLFHANDVTREQYLLAAKEGGFFGILPNKIVREYIGNQDTLDKLANCESGTPEFLNTFLNETSNGKHTSYILKDFNLQAIKAEWDPNSFKTIIIGVQPG